MKVRAAIFLLLGQRPLLAGAAMALALGGPSAVLATPQLPANASPVTKAAMAEAQRRAPYPTFAHLPSKPTGLRTLAAWKSAIADIKTTGRQEARLSVAEPWTLADTEAWAAQQRAEAQPPRPITSPADAATDAAVAAMRERAKEPPRSH